MPVMQSPEWTHPHTDTTRTAAVTDRFAGLAIRQPPHRRITETRLAWCRNCTHTHTRHHHHHHDLLMLRLQFTILLTGK